MYLSYAKLTLEMTRKDTIKVINAWPEGEKAMLISQMASSSMKTRKAQFAIQYGSTEGQIDHLNWNRI